MVLGVGGRLAVSLRCADPDSDSLMTKRRKAMVRVCMRFEGDLAVEFHCSRRG
jgi:hypothetical protein